MRNKNCLKITLQSVVQPVTVVSAHLFQLFSLPHTDAQIHLPVIITTYLKLNTDSLIQRKGCYDSLLYMSQECVTAILLILNFRTQSIRNHLPYQLGCITSAMVVLFHTMRIHTKPGNANHIMQIGENISPWAKTLHVTQGPECYVRRTDQTQGQSRRAL